MAPSPSAAVFDLPFAFLRITNVEFPCFLVQIFITVGFACLSFFKFARIRVNSRPDVLICVSLRKSAADLVVALLLRSTNPKFLLFLRKFFIHIFHFYQFFRDLGCSRVLTLLLSFPDFLRGSVSPWWVLGFGCGSAMLCLRASVVGVLSLPLKLVASSSVNIC